MHSEKAHPIGRSVANPGEPLAVAKRDSEDQKPKISEKIGGLLFPRLRREREAHAATAQQLEIARGQLIESMETITILHGMANTDILTGLGNRRMFDSRLDEELTSFLRSGRDLAVLLIDLDNFKVVNDQFGHDFGDIVLKGAAGKLLSAVRHADLVFRIGGDEFAVLVPSGNIDIGQTLKGRIKSVFANHGADAGVDSDRTISHGVGFVDQKQSSRDTHIGASVGFATISSEIEVGSAISRKELLEQIADAPSGDKKELLERTYVDDMGKALIRSADADMYADKQASK